MILQTPCAYVRPEPPAPFIYALVDPLDSGHIRYVGMANRTMLRPFDHAKSARKSQKNSHLLNWIRQLQASGREPSVLILEQLSEGASLELVGAVETAYIASLRSIGHKLTNLATGGSGAGGKHHPGTGANISRAKKGRATPEFRAALSARNKGNTYGLGKRRTEEEKRHLSATHKRLHAETDVYANAAAKRRGRGSPLAGKRQSEDTKRRMSEGKKASWDRLTIEQRAAHAANVSKAMRKSLEAKRLVKSNALLLSELDSFDTPVETCEEMTL